LVTELDATASVDDGMAGVPHAHFALCEKYYC